MDRCVFTQQLRVNVKEIDTMRKTRQGKEIGKG